jgi:HAE1 family hydrophobic/amphiphilic exporter-1
MRLSNFFITRPIFAIVLSLFITIVGAVAYFALPVAQYPEVAPPTIQVTATYPGASAEVLSETVATPLEQQLNGIESLLYFSSQSTGDGKLVVTLTFKLGTDLSTAESLTQSRVLIAQPRLPEPVQQLGLTVKKVASDYLIVPHLFSPDGSRDQLYLSNYATLHIKDAIARLDGVGDVQTFGARDYAMRIWLDPAKVAADDLTAGDVVAALRAQNVQVAAGVLAQPPVGSSGAFQINVETLGRLTDPAQFADVIVKSDADGRVTRVRDIGRVELGALDYSANGYKDNVRSVPILIYRQPGSNELTTAREIRKTMAELAKDFPPGVAYENQYDATVFIAQSVHEVVIAIVVAIVLVVLVVILFLQTWRASIIPIAAIPVSLVGTFTVLAALGFSLNNLSLFGLVLAVGIVVDDAIVVVENVERNLRLGYSPAEAARRTMDEVGGALIAIALTLCAVFVPAAFISGISGEFFRQFAVTIAASTIISCFVSLTLSPALCAVLLLPHRAHDTAQHRSLLVRLVGGFFAAFNRGFEWLSDRFGRLTNRLIRVSAVVLIAYAGLTALTGVQFSRAHRLHSPTRPGIPHHSRAAAARLFARPDRRRCARGERDPDRDTRCLLDSRLCRPGWGNADKCLQRRRHLLGVQAVRGARRPGPHGRRDPGVDQQAARHDRQRVRYHHPAAADQWHRQCRRLQDDAGGQEESRPGRPRDHGTGTCCGGQCGPTPGGCVHALHQHHTQCLCRYQPFPGRQAGRAGAASFRGTAGLSGLGLHQRLQLSGPDLPGHGAGG